MTRPLAAAVLPLVLAVAAGAATTIPPDATHVPGRVVLRLSDALAPQMQSAIARGRGAVSPSGSPALDALMRRHRAARMRAPFAVHATPSALAARFPRRAARATPGTPATLDHIFVLELASDLDVDQAAREYARLPGVVWAEPDRIAHAVLVPNDPFFASSGTWGQPYRDLWGLVIIGAPSAWDVTRGAGVLVAISDTGVDAAHPDLAARMWTNPGEIPGNGIDDDGNGFIDDIHGWDASNEDGDPFDDNGHGTHVAGTVAAAGNNALGVIGVAWESSVMAVKGLGAGGSGSHVDLAEGIVYAVDNGADVINASWGGFGSQLMTDTVAAAHAAGVVFVAAAGNEASDVAGFSPANIHEAIAVSAFDHTDQRASFSNFGTKIDVAAPGGGDAPPPADQPSRSILSLRSSGSQFDNSLNVASLYTRLSGTSMAAPHVAGAAALVLAAHPEFNPEQVRQALRVSADDVGAPGFDVDSGHGRLNVDRAVRMTNVLSVDIASPAPGTQVAGVVTISGTAAGSGFVEYTLEYGGIFWNPIAGPVGTPVESGVLATWDVTNVPDGTHMLRLRARNTDGVWFEDRVSVVIDSVDITSPSREDVVGVGGAPIEVRGTAAGALFQGYLVQYRVIEPNLTVGSWTSAGVTLPGGGITRVSNGLLATIDPSVLPGPRDLDIRLRVDIGPLDLVDVVEHVVADPTLRPGWPRRVAPFGAPVSASVTLADLDGNGGKEILLVADGQIVVLRADGSDLPGWPRTPGVGYQFAPEPPSVADLDGDLLPEVVTPTTRGVEVRRADGTLLTEFSQGGGYPPQGPITLADLDGNGRRDLIYAAHTLVHARRLDGSSLPGFSLSRGCNPAMPCYEDAVAVGDVDGDGDLELAVIATDVRSKQYLDVYDGNGTRRARFPRKISHRQRVIGNLPVMADIDGDGALEVAFNDDSSYVNAYSGGGKKRHFPRRSKLPEWEQKARPTIRSAQEPITAGDLDGDGIPELLVAQSFPETILKRGKPPLTLPPPYLGQDYLVAVKTIPALYPGVWSQSFFYPRAEKAYGPGTAAIGDIDGDGQQDAVIGSGTCAYWGFVDDIDLRRCYTVYAFRPDASLLPGFPKPTAKAGKSKLATPALGDLDGDGLKEIVWVNDNNDVLVWTIPGTPGPENMQWPMYRHDAAHTGALPATP